MAPFPPCRTLGYVVSGVTCAEALEARDGRSSVHLAESRLLRKCPVPRTGQPTRLTLFQGMKEQAVNCDHYRPEQEEAHQTLHSALTRTVPHEVDELGWEQLHRCVIASTKTGSATHLQREGASSQVGAPHARIGSRNESAAGTRWPSPPRMERIKVDRRARTAFRTLASSKGEAQAPRAVAGPCGPV